MPRNANRYATGGVCVDCVITDPPYNINLTPQRKNAGTQESRLRIQNDNLDEGEFFEWLCGIFKQCYALLKPDAFLITFMGWQTIPIFNKALTAAGFTIKSMPVWIKESFGIGYYTRPQYEQMYLCMKGNPPRPAHPISDVINAARERNIVHSCQKPNRLLQTLLNTFTAANDLVLDPFGGSFTTAINCRKCGRRYISCEIDGTLYAAGAERLKTETAQTSIFDIFGGNV